MHRYHVNWPIAIWIILPIMISSHHNDLINSGGPCIQHEVGIQLASNSIMSPMLCMSLVAWLPLLRITAITVGQCTLSPLPPTTDAEHHKPHVPRLGDQYYLHEGGGGDSPLLFCVPRDLTVELDVLLMRSAW